MANTARLTAAVVVLGMALAPIAARAGKFTTLYTFKGGADGSNPGYVVVRGSQLYGTTYAGGLADMGTLFALDLKTGVETILHNFDSAPAIAQGDDGQHPMPGLAYHDRALYGATWAGGSTSNGVVFKFDLATGVESVLYAFAGGNADGGGPAGGPVYHRGALYGLTSLYGTGNWGTAYTLPMDNHDDDILHDFNVEPHDGSVPQGSPTIAHGSMYGVTLYGGTRGNGIVFKINLATGAETTLHNFDCHLDGALPIGGVTYVRGYLYGLTTTFGPNRGCNTYNQNSAGTVFKMDVVTGATTVLHAFKGNRDHRDHLAGARLTYYNGAIYGTASSVGDEGGAIIFKIDLKTGAYSKLHTFADYDANGLTLQDGAFYGTTTGSVFKFVP